MTIIHILILFYLIRDGYKQVREIIFQNAKREGDTKVENRYLNFLNIVDINDDSFKDHIARDYAGRFGDGQFFRIGIILVIFANAIFIGLQTDPNFVCTLELNPPISWKS